MTVARREIVDASEPGVYHCVSRCVRRAYLCGRDAYSGRDFSHRKSWIRDRLSLLTDVFGMRILTYAVMDNHLHIILCTNPDAAAKWSTQEVVRRWRRLIGESAEGAANGHDNVTEGDTIDVIADVSLISTWRERLSSISWFMRCLNEHIARRANREDECKGRFWEGRFKCTRLLDEASILTCMTYVDLNPVRAAMVDSLHEPQFTGAFDRLEARRGRQRLAGLQQRFEGQLSTEEPLVQPPDLASSSPRLNHHALPANKRRRIKKIVKRERQRSLQSSHLVALDGDYSPLRSLGEQEYLGLLDWAGRQLKNKKSGSIPADAPDVLAELDIDTENWLSAMEHFDDWFAYMAGRVTQLIQAARRLGKRWLKGFGPSRKIFLQPPST